MRKRSSLTVVESAKVLECALQAPRIARVDDVFVTESIVDHPLIQRLVASPPTAAMRLWRATSAVSLRTDTVTAPHVAAIVHCEPEFMRESAFKSYLAAAGPRATVAVLHDLQNPTNVGALLRSAAAFDTAVVITGQNSADLLNPKCVRASAGAIFTLPALWVEPDVALVARLLKSTGFDIVHAAAGDDSGSNTNVMSMIDVCARQRVAFLLGNEGSGVDALTERLATSRVHIETSRRVESLNVGVAGALLLCERFRRQR